MMITKSLIIVAVASALVTGLGTGTEQASAYGHQTAARPARYLGVAGVSPRALGAFQSATHVRPNLVELSQTFGSAYPATEIARVHRRGALPFLQLSPFNHSLQSIWRGAADGYLRRLGRHLAALKYPVALSFAPEANGNWDRWGCHRSSAAAYVDAWRHVHRVIDRAGARRIIWVWVVNRSYHGSCPIAARYPGSSYVNWVGLDGYFNSSRTTFASVFGHTLAQLRAITGTSASGQTVARSRTGKPVLIAETGVPDISSAPAEVSHLFAGALRHPQVVGVTYFNRNGTHGNYRLQDDPAALARFTVVANRYLNGGHR